MGIAVIHLVQLVPTFEATPLLGGAFVLLIAGAVAVGARLISSKLTHAQLWLPVVALGVAACALSLSPDICNHRKSTSAISECRGGLTLALGA
jgi:hypothetical protein